MILKYSAIIWVKTILIVLAAISTNAQITTPDLNYTQQLSHFPAMGCCPSSMVDEQNYSVVFREDFNGTTLNTAEWKTNFLFTDNRCYWTASGYPNAEAVYFGDEGENVFVKDGKLMLKADTLTQAVNCGNKTAHYSVGQIWSKQKWKYGRFECKFMVPEGTFIFPAIWMQNNVIGASSRDEIDLVEAYGWHDNGGPGMHYGTGSLNSTSYGSWDTYNQSIRSDQNDVLLHANQWQTTTLDWTPYKMVIKLNGQVILESHRYYKQCGGEQYPIECFEDLPACLEGEKFFENMSFPDDSMNFSAWLNIQPVKDWKPGESIYSTTPVPAYMFVDYIQVEQTPVGTWGVCEEKNFCTFSVMGHKQDTINLCTDGILSNPDTLTLYPFSTFWNNTQFSHSNNLNMDRHNQRLFIQSPIATEGTSWFEIKAMASQYPSCIGQDRVIRKVFKHHSIFNEPSEVELDGVLTLQNNKSYTLEEGLHTIRLISPVNDQIKYEYIITHITNGSTYASGNELTFDFAYSLSGNNNYYVDIKRIDKLCGGTELYHYTFKVARENCLPEVYINEVKEGDGNIYDYQTSDWSADATLKTSLCFGSHTVTLPQGWTMHYAAHRINEVPHYLNITGNSFIVEASSETQLYYFTSSGEGCQMFMELEISGMDCVPQRVDNRLCLYDTYPNPAGDFINIGPVSASGAAMIKDIKVYNRDMLLVRDLQNLEQNNYVLDTDGLEKGSFYIVQITDTQDRVCRKPVLLAR